MLVENTTANLEVNIYEVIGELPGVGHAVRLLDVILNDRLSSMEKVKEIAWILADVGITAGVAVLSGGIAIAGKVLKGLVKARKPAMKLKRKIAEMRRNAKANGGAARVDKPCHHCFVAGTLVATAAGLAQIEEVQVGERVLTEDLAGWEQQAGEGNSTAVDPATWRKVTLHLESAGEEDGFVDIVTLRPLSWIAEKGLQEGQWSDFSSGGWGMEGQAFVSAIEPCPPIAEGEGQVVLTTFSQVNGRPIYALQLYGGDGTEEIVVTRGHPFFSATRQGWAPVEELVEGEQIRSMGGASLQVVARLELPAGQRVYNLEIERDHSYLVSEGLVLCHNCGDGAKSRPYDRPETETRSGNSVKDTDVTSDWDEFLGPNQTNIDPRDGLPDPDRVWSADGKRSIRYGEHEMTSRPNREHYHKETWHDDRVENVLQRIQRTKSQ